MCERPDDTSMRHYGSSAGSFSLSRMLTSPLTLCASQTIQFLLQSSPHDDQWQLEELNVNPSMHWSTAGECRIHTHTLTAEAFAVWLVIKHCDTFATCSQSCESGAEPSV